MLELSWNLIKQKLDDGLPYYGQFDKFGNENVICGDGAIAYICYLNNPSDDYDDWNDNYKSGSKKSLNPIDPDTGTPSISTKKLPAGWYPEFREIEFTTATKDSIHDKDEDDADLWEHSIHFYNGNVDISDNTQADILLNCNKTIVRFAPGRAWAIRGAYTRQIAIPASPVYVWTTLIVEVAPGFFMRNPYANGGLNMEFQDVRQSVGDEGDNYTFFNQNDQIEWVIRHNVGIQHRIRVIYQFGFEVGS